MPHAGGVPAAMDAWPVALWSVYLFCCQGTRGWVAAPGGVRSTSWRALRGAVGSDECVSVRLQADSMTAGELEDFRALIQEQLAEASQQLGRQIMHRFTPEALEEAGALYKWQHSWQAAIKKAENGSEQGERRTRLWCSWRYRQPTKHLRKALGSSITFLSFF
jgi:hypothetical protein